MRLWEILIADKRWVANYDVHVATPRTGPPGEEVRVRDVDGFCCEAEDARNSFSRCFGFTSDQLNCLKLLMYPFMPFSSEELHSMLGFSGKVAEGGWEWQGTSEFMPPGQHLGEPKPLFTKLDDSMVTEENARLGANVV